MADSKKTHVPFSDSSRSMNWGYDLADGEYPGDERMKIGCLQRIAESLELLTAPIRAANERTVNIQGHYEEILDMYRKQYAAATKLRAQLKRLNAKIAKEKAKIAPDADGP